MDLRNNWTQVRATFDASIKSSLHCAIASVGPDGHPHITPIGFVFLRDDHSAFYFEEYPTKLPRNLSQNPRVCLLLVNSDRWFWLKALVRGKFSTPPGMRLLGVAGERRPATDRERNAYHARVTAFSRLKGYALIWKDLRYVRDITLVSVEPVSYPVMTDGLWR